jgi:hypothetical protein
VEVEAWEGAGDDDVSRLRGLGSGIEEDVDLGVRVGGGILRYGDGVVCERGLKLWPTIKSLVFGLEFQRGLLLIGVADGRWRRLLGRGVTELPFEVRAGDRGP